MHDDERKEATTSLESLGHKMTRGSVRDFQTAHHIKVDGIIGPQTMGALRGAVSERDHSKIDQNTRVTGEHRAPTEDDRRCPPNGTTPLRDLQTAHMPENQKWDQYAAMIRANGGTVNPGGRASVLGIRARDGVTHNFEDKMVVLTPDHRVHEFSASTRPSNTTSRNGGVAELRPGNYDVRPHGPHYGRPSWQVFTQSGSGSVPVYRDRNGDGQYSAREKATPATGTGILFHVPNPRYHDSTPTSIGCINIRNRDWNRFMGAVGGSNQRFSFTLVDRN
jgi:hypothetical protein